MNQRWCDRSSIHWVVGRVKEGRHISNGADLRFTLPASPSPLECFTDHWDENRSAVERRPNAVPVAAATVLVGPLPDALAEAQLLPVHLLQPVLHAHEGR